MTELDLSEAGLTECEAVIQRSMEAVLDAGQALVRIRDAKLYKGRYQTFERYCQKRWGFTRQRADQLMAAAEVIEIVAEVDAPALSNGHYDHPNGDDVHVEPVTVPVPPPATERVARELAPLRKHPEEMIGAWQEANGRAAQYGRAPTSTDVRAAVQGRVMGPVARAPANPAPGSQDRVDKIVESWATLANATREVIDMERKLISDVDLTDNQRWCITEAHKHAQRAVDGR